MNIQMARMSQYSISAPVNPPAIGDCSPWGVIDDIKPLGIGVLLTTTPSHGGLWLSVPANNLIPEQFRRVDRWYEEDCEIVIALAFVQSLLTDSYTVEFCKDGLPSDLSLMFPPIYRYCREKGIL